MHISKDFHVVSFKAGMTPGILREISVSDVYKY